ncbi:N-acetyltransferase [Spiractinospora alimapuensis]|uniref:N-acetyltransferase n=1 Tax=Spiractinospora alimapuensis TaxID=2820884 RepID=UPI001F17DFFC|nr:N-acetyltransferase [Spiractinospora alimapuensis]QVQ50305.1 N-acetyltransferase [Spiractinospora alimapuensis]
MGELVVRTLADDPALIDVLRRFPDTWPRFIIEDPWGEAYYSHAADLFPEHVQVAWDTDDPRTPVARAFSVPFVSDTEERSSLPEHGWDAVIQWALQDRIAGRTPTVVSALEITIHPERRGGGHAAELLNAMRTNTKALGYTELVAPVRPTGKAAEPQAPMTEYAHRTREDGLPLDPWLRVHVRLGGEIVGVCARSMTIAGSVAEWRAWTGLPFDEPGDVVVPRGLVPVHCDPRHDHAVYVEPGVWVRHRM